MEDQQLQSQSFMPLLSRVDRLDSVITYIEKKEKLSRWRKSNNSKSMGKKKDKKVMALNVAAHEANSKGSLMDRILSLEDRLVQLSQEIESSSRASSSCSIQSTSLWTNTNTNTTATSSSSCGVSKSELRFNSYPIFDFPMNRERKSESEIQKKPQKVQQPGEQQQQENEGEKEEEKTCKCEKKKRAISWRRLKLLGC